MIKSITLQNLLPFVFRGMEASDTIRQSQVWLMPNLSFDRGCRICIQAESGGGKSSLLSFIYGNRNDYQGEILFDRDNSRHFDVKKWCQLRTRHIALLPQEMRMFPELTVMQNLQLKNKLTHHKTRDELMQLLDRLGIADKANQRVGLLSIGQQQRVAIVRAICQPFDFIMLDEPVSHLDRNNNLIVSRIIDEEATSQGAGIITTSVGNPLLLENARFIAL